MKKGFTLIELLAVIVILAVIAFIATPMIMNVIEKARIGAAIESVNGLLDACEKYQLDYMMNGKDDTTTIDLTTDILKHKGKKPNSGTLVIGTKGRMSIIAEYDKYCIVKTFDEKTPHIVDRTPCVIEDSELIDLPNYKEPLLNGEDPVFTSTQARISDTTSQGLIPITIENGVVKKANLKKTGINMKKKDGQML